MDQPGDQELYDQLLGYLAAEGEIEEDRDSGAVVLTEFDHRALPQPLRLHLTPGEFGEHLRAMATDATGLWPGVAPIEAAWRLFTVHLDEAVQTARPGETDLVLLSGGVASSLADGTRAPLAPEIEEHVALSRYHERLISHLADRGEVTVDRDGLTVHALDGRSVQPPLRLRIEAGELRQRLREADDPEAAWSTVVHEIDRLVGSVDPTETELALTRDGVVALRPESGTDGEPGSGTASTPS